jgi:hypothetical protein
MHDVHSKRPLLAIDDVWTKNSLQDIVDMLCRQKLTRTILTASSRQGYQGLALLPSVKVGSQLEQLVSQEYDLGHGDRQALSKLLTPSLRCTSPSRAQPTAGAAGGVEVVDSILAEQLFQQAKGVKHLRFMRNTSSILQQTIRSLTNSVVSKPAGHTMRTNLATTAAATTEAGISRKHLVTSPSRVSDTLYYRLSPSSASGPHGRVSSKQYYPRQASSPPGDPCIGSPYTEALYSPQHTHKVNSSRCSSDRLVSTTKPGDKTSRSKQRIYRPLSDSAKILPHYSSTSHWTSPNSGQGVVANAGQDEVNKLYREITELSTHTNLKYLHICDTGIQLLSTALSYDRSIIKLTLSRAHISDHGLSSLIDILPSMKMLKYLDLSYNCFGDDSIHSLTDALLTSYQAGNRGVIDYDMQAMFSTRSQLSLGRDRSYKPTIATNTIQTLSIAGNRGSLQGIVYMIQGLFSNEATTSKRQQGKLNYGHRLYWLR